jgi:hypothetical protein
MNVKFVFLKHTTFCTVADTADTSSLVKFKDGNTIHFFVCSCKSDWPDYVLEQAQSHGFRS